MAQTNNSPKNTLLNPKLAILGYQIIFYILVMLSIYAIVTLNWLGIFFLIFLIIVQQPFNERNYTYINFVAPYVQKYVKIQRIYEEKLQDQEKSLFCFVPHSILGFGLICNLNYRGYPQNDKLSNAYGLGSRFALSLPIFGLLFKFWGTKAVDSKSFGKLMQEGKSLALVPGGFQEATITTPDQMRIYIQNRKGFIKYGLKYGYKIRPVLILKQHQVFKTFDGLRKFRLLLNKIKIPGTVYWGDYGLLFPPNKQMITIIGKAANQGIQIKQGQIPTLQQINQVHQAYKQQIKRLYEKYKHLNGDKEIKFF